MILKYQEDIAEKIGECQCPNFPEIYVGNAYCFVHEDTQHPNNFKPQGKQKPERVIKEKHLDKKCELFGLSFFVNQTKAVELYKIMEGRGNYFKNQNGTLLAKVSLSIKEGFRDKIDAKTHFNFYEWYNTNLFKNILNTVEIELIQ